LKASGWRGIELGPVELLLNAVTGFFPVLAPRPQALQCRALGGDRAQPQFVVFGSSLRSILVFGDVAGGRVFLAAIVAVGDVSPSRLSSAACMTATRAREVHVRRHHRPRMGRRFLVEAPNDEARESLCYAVWLFAGPAG